MPKITPEQIAWQKANAADFNASGLSAFCISGIIIVVIAVLLRLWSRKMQKVPLQADDYTLVVATVLSVAAVILFDIRVYHWGLGRHFQSLSLYEQVVFEKIDYAFNLAYTTGYPLSRISLVLLYHRIFIQTWVRRVCWFFVFVFSAYMVSTIIIDSMLTLPVNAYWDHTITPRHTVDLVKLYIANAAFNIATDSILLILPVSIIWRLSMTRVQKAGLTAVFAMGGFTLVASIARLVFFYQVDSNDISYTLIPIVWWTSAELFLGVLCPCLVTFRPLLRALQSFLYRTLSRANYQGTGKSVFDRYPFPTLASAPGARHVVPHHLHRRSISTTVGDEEGSLNEKIMGSNYVSATSAAAVVNYNKNKLAMDSFDPRMVSQTDCGKQFGTTARAAVSPNTPPPPNSTPNSTPIASTIPHFFNHHRRFHQSNQFSAPLVRSGSVRTPVTAFNTNNPINYTFNKYKHLPPTPQPQASSSAHSRTSSSDDWAEKQLEYEHEREYRRFEPCHQLSRARQTLPTKETPEYSSRTRSQPTRTMQPVYAAPPAFGDYHYYHSRTFPVASIEPTQRPEIAFGRFGKGVPDGQIGIKRVYMLEEEANHG